MNKIEEIKQRLRTRQAMGKEERTLDNSLNILFKGEDDDIEHLLLRIKELESDLKLAETERDRLSKLLIEERMKIVDLRDKMKELQIQVKYEQDRNRNNVCQADERIKELEETIRALSERE